MEYSNSRPLYEDSVKATDTTGAGFNQINNNLTNDLFKEDSESSDQAVIPNQIHLPPQIYYRGEVQHDEIRKFMKKADKLNEVNYRKLQMDRTLVPQSSTLNIYKSNKNILEEISGDLTGQRRDKQIRQIYLGGKDSKPKRRSLNQNKLNRTSYLPSNKKKMLTSTKEVQTEIKTENYSTTEIERGLEMEKKKNHKRYPSLSMNAKKKMNNTLNAIEEDEDEDFIPQKKKHKNRVFNTISLTGQTAELLKHKNNTNRYLQNLSKVQHSFTTSLKRYDFRQQTDYKTVFHNNQPPRAATTFLKPIVNAPVQNPWDDLQDIKKESRTQRILPLENQNNTDNIKKDKQNTPIQIQKRQNTSNEVIPIVNNGSQRMRVVSESKIQGQDKIPEIPKTSTRKKSFSQHSTFHAPTDNSMMVEQNHSGQKTNPSEYSFTIQKGHTSSNFYESKNLFPDHTKPQVDTKNQFTQAPLIRQIAIGTDTNNFTLPKKGPIHPININFTQGDAGWITGHYKPKSQFIRKMDMKNFEIKKYKNGVYFGEISEDGQKHGKGVVFYFNGRSYEGSFIEDTKQGKGFEYLADGSTYKGDFKNGLKEGKGIFQWQNGEVYDGQWVKGKKNGSGMWKSPNGDSYIGEWKNGKVQGFGVLVLKEGDRYEGQFRNSMKSGLGTERYANGDTYVGQFLKNRPNGQGQYYYHYGDYFKGTFSNGLKHGDGYYKSKQGQIFQGQFRNDKKSGFGELSKPDGSLYRGNFENDLQHGYGELKMENSVSISGYWINGKKVDEDMGVIEEDELERQQSIPGPKKAKINRQSMFETKPKKKVAKKSPKVSAKKSIEKQVSPDDPNIKRACGCKRKH